MAALQEDAMNENTDPITGGTTGGGVDPTAPGMSSADMTSTPRSGSAADETFGWTADDQSAGGDARATAERMLSQLQSMIDTVATQAAPVVRQIGAKAAELAAVAADRAGPLAHRAADATADASVRIAERSRTLAADLRSRTSDTDGDGSIPLEGADDAIERAAKDDPAEGRPL
jgi:hypothetical protein